MRAAGIALFACVAAPAAGQVVERHLPPAPATTVPQLSGVASSADADDRPLGPRLAGITLLGPGARAVSGGGIRLIAVAPPDRATLVRALAALLGRPVSRKLVADAVAIVTRNYRRAERPFLSVTTPPQDLSAGVLQLQVIEFTAGRLAARAPTAAAADETLAQIRFPPGQPIDARRLRQDLGWLDRFPFRRTAAVFSAGAAPGTTDLTVNVVPRRPWRGFAGIASSDAPSGGEVRVLAGVVIGNLLGSGSLVSVQGTTSDFVRPRYWSIAGRIAKPLGPRQEVSVLVSHVSGRRALAPFTSRSDTIEAVIDLRLALPPALLGDAHVAIEAGRQRTEARFEGLPVYDVEAATFAALAGYSVVVPTASGVLSAEVAIHISPGGIGRANHTDRLFFGRPRSGSATYAYISADIAIEQKIAAKLNWRGQAIVQASATPLPGVDQIGIGGSAYGRGYTLDDGGYDNAFIVRNALGPRTGKLPAYVFSDWGYGNDLAARRTRTFGSVGLGLTQTIGNGIRVVAEAALPLLDAPRTKAMQPRLLARADLSF